MKNYTITELSKIFEWIESSKNGILLDKVNHGKYIEAAEKLIVEEVLREEVYPSMQNSPYRHFKRLKINYD